MINEELLRRVLRQEIERLLPELRAAPAYLTLRECAQRYRLGYGTIQEKVRSGALLTVTREMGRNGRPQRLIVALDAEAKLGPGL